MKITINREEIFTGLVFGAAFAPFTEFWTLLLAPLSAVLWERGGTVNKNFRRFGNAAIAASVALLAGLSPALALLTGAAVHATLRLGYGIPTSQPPDEGSDIGRFWFHIFHAERPAQFFTRMTIGFLLAVSFGFLVKVSIGDWTVGAVLLTLGLPMIADIVEGTWEINI